MSPEERRQARRQAAKDKAEAEERYKAQAQAFLDQNGHTYGDSPEERERLTTDMDASIKKEYGMGFILTAILSAIISKIVAWMIDKYYLERQSTARRQ